MDLHSGTYFWPQTYLDAPTYEQLNENISCDVLIIGAGCSGAHCAHYLSQFDLNVVVIDKREVARGSTVVSTALLQYIGDKMFHQLAHSFGEEIAALHHRLCKLAIDDIEKLSKTMDVNPHFQRRDSLLFSSSPDDVSMLKKEYNILKKYNFPVEWLTRQDIGKRYSFTKDAAITTLNDAEINPYIYTHNLINIAAKRGVRVYERTEIIGKKLEKHNATLFTKNKRSVKAKHVIFATGYEYFQFKKERNTSLESSYALFTNQLTEDTFYPWYKRSLIWETARPYLYIRTTNDNRVIIGGLDEPTSLAEIRDAKLINKKNKLIKVFNELFPTIKVRPEYYYAAFYGGTHDGLPMIGMYEELPHCYFLLCFGDNGLVYSNVMSKIIGDSIVKGTSEHLPIYLQTRPLKP
ncbi:FAD-dependent oxidoreductase [Lottiidibacillus patelloidae]|uniref:FAD-dependent oxidoreductase n=1 Tax=Lottiidibacillus patelloidae TaxID=2670334 RepID=A0A263BSK0_9BACI|nr:FAD-dependent oxidoreductase [Lottiidibacillus patelloidae]OZM56690.1 FAD-dependent oxidoreductase [Lottiidibacillus patelloidae]